MKSSLATVGEDVEIGEGSPQTSDHAKLNTAILDASIAESNSSSLTEPSPTPPSSQPGPESNRVPSVQVPHSPQPSPSFRESNICVAVDVSASTYDSILDAEKHAIQDICKLIPRKLRPRIHILPWNDGAGEPVDLDGIHSLFADGGTNPNTFLDDHACRDLLQDADFWFLMTDGEIDDSLVRRFARGIREYGLHGKACIICVFGDRAELPATCNITVGISVFAVSPHVAFLYNDVTSGKTYVLQTKGCFSALLPPGHPPPSLDYNTTWEDLPLTSFENLSRVHVPPPEIVGRDEVILQDNSKLNMSKFLQELPSDDRTISQILDHEENCNTIALAAKLRDEADKLQLWLDRVDKKLESESQDISPKMKESALLNHVTQNLWVSDDMADTRTVIHRPKMVQSIPQHLPEIHEQSADNLPSTSSYETGTNSHRRTSSGHMRRLSSTSVEFAGDNLSRDSESNVKPSKAYSSSYSAPVPNYLGPYDSFLSAPGFTKPPKSKDSFQGKCMRCSNSSAELCLLLRSPTDTAITSHFPAAGTQSVLLYPLTLGNYAEMDILSSDLLCDTCALKRMRMRGASEGNDIKFSLPLVSFLANEPAWCATIHHATLQRFHVSNLPVVFVGILYTKLERLLQETQHTFSDLGKAIKWMGNMLLSEVILQPSEPGMPDGLGTGALHEVLLRNFQGTLANPSSTALLEYPIDGFIVANAALSNSRHSIKLSGSKRKTIVYLKFLYHIAENLFRFEAQNDETVVRTAKSLVLFSDESNGSSSLFKWRELREISVRFKDATEMRKFFSRTRPFKLSISTKDLTGTPFLESETLRNFERLGVLFNWISSHAAHATAVFLHHLFRLETKAPSALDLFAELQSSPEIQQLIKDPADISAKNAEELIKRLPPL
jgi:hypothetical protein